MTQKKTAKKKFKTPADSESFIAEIVGEESQLGQRMSAGKLLHMMDMAAASADVKHAVCPVVTLAFDRIEFLDFVFHMDYVRYNAYVIHVGKSSIVVKVDGYTKSPTEIEIQPANSGVITMVALDKNRKPNKNIPALEYRTAADLDKKRMAEDRESLCKRRQEEIKKVDGLKSIRTGELKDFYDRKYLIKQSKTAMKIRNIFLPRNANTMGVVFGGDTIEMMEELALATARQFTGNFRMVTIAMEDVFFLKPLPITNLVEMSSAVTFVAGSTLTVEITVTAIDFMNPEKKYVTNKGVFTIFNYDRTGSKKNITIGLDMTGSDLELRKNYLKEQIKYDNRKNKLCK